MKMRKSILRIIFFTLLFVILLASVVHAAPAISVTKDGVTLGDSQDPKDVASSIEILLLLTVLTLAPAILIMMTSFTRIIVVLSFLRNALGTQQMPPNQVLIGLALFLTFFIMAPVGKDLNDKALQPYTKGTITQQAALDTSSDIIKKFMLSNIHRDQDLALFTSLSKVKTPVKKEDLPLTTVIPAFVISELRIAFQMGFLIFIPFLIIDMVVSSTLMSMGMMMLPPVMISLPFKILLFILVDGWNLVVQALVKSFAGW